MKEIFKILVQELEEGKSVVLVAIIEGSGSIPRGAGAYMLVGEKGRLAGTIGGGNLEYQAEQTGMECLKEKRNLLQEYNLGSGEAADLGMVCGGHAKVLFYFLDSNEEKTKNFVYQGCETEKRHRPYWLLLPLETGEAEIRDVVDEKRHHIIIEENGRRYYAEKFCYDGKVYIFGGGHLAQEVVPILSHLGFQCIVADDRDEFVREELFPGAEQVIKTDFKNLSDLFEIKEEDYIAIMTRGHLCDTDAERFALKTNAAYVGVVGSARKTAYVRAKLSEEGFSDSELNRIRTPIGLDIGSETPEEIAISIAAELIQFRAEKR